MDRCSDGVDCWNGCAQHVRYWRGIRERLDREGLQCVVDDLTGARDAIQEVWDKGWPVRREDLEEAHELIGQITNLLMKLEDMSK